MPHTHPHAEATYRVIPLDDEGFAVEVNIPDCHPARVSKFATASDAEAWIVEHRRKVETEGQGGRWFRRSGRPRQ